MSNTKAQKMAEKERSLRMAVNSAGRMIRLALDRAEEAQSAADAAWGAVQGARVRCGRAQEALARHRFEVGVYGPCGRRTFKKVSK